MWVKFNINNHVRVKLTDAGRNELKFLVINQKCLKKMKTDSVSGNCGC